MISAPRPLPLPTRLLLALLASSATVSAQAVLGNANPRELVPQAGSTLFVANPARGAAALFRTDGTSGGATSLGSFRTADDVPSPAHLTMAGGTAFFTADDGSGIGTELWASDGTTAGTRLVADLRRGPDSSSPQGLVGLPSGIVVFSAVTDTRGREPWASDGATATPLADIRLGGLGSSPADFVAAGGRVFFTARDAVAGRELWVTDGTSAGTARVRDIRPGSESSSPSSLFAYRGELWFCANDGASGYELWRSDGTASGTRRVVDLNPGAGSSQPGEFAEAFGRLFFVAHDGLRESRVYSTDGTALGTVPLMPPTGPHSPSHLTVAAGRLWFVADDGVHGAELWSTDGTVPGTAMVRDLYPGFQSSRPDQIVEMDAATVVFVANGGAVGRELWRAGPNGAVLVRELWPGQTSGRITGMRRHQGNVLFAAQARDGAGSELFRTDGTAAGTYRLENLNTATEQLTLEMFHTVDALGLQNIDFIVPSGKAAALVIGTRIGPGVDLNRYGLPSYGLYGLTWPAVPILVGSAGPGVAGVQIQLPQGINLSAQAATLNPVVFSGVTNLTNGPWDMSRCPSCANVPLNAERTVYVDDTYEYDLEFSLPTTRDDVWLRVMRLSADGSTEQVEFQPIRPGTTRLRGQVELRRSERLELRVYCSDPDGSCWAGQILGC